ncbi:hypothetical protein MCAP1_000014 [Malassezia caprae]|uniref:CMP/dCMP-type deaminase domain-containing protein n=1 Tax=Malassezia caprae TaxID=1381934 RepID=A0AAF0E3D8_9BASI|nr:hypothetical protein MCAP1_000014 [Malassezia caprae]
MIGCATYVPKEAQSPDDLRWMRVALSMAQEAFDHGEVPVGCVFVREGRILAQARNRTNELLNATRHAELEAIDEILQETPPKDPQFGRSPHSGPEDDNVLLGTTLYVTIEPCLIASYLALETNDSVEMGLDALSYNPPYESQGGYLREEAIMILRQFYMTENTKGAFSC